MTIRELRAFSRAATPRLEFEPHWFDDANSNPITTADVETKIAESAGSQQLSASTPYGI